MMFLVLMITACGKQTDTNISVNESTESALPLSEVEADFCMSESVEDRKGLEVSAKYEKGS